MHGRCICVRCQSELLYDRLERGLSQTSKRGWYMVRDKTITEMLKAFLLPVNPELRNVWRRGYLRHHLLPHGYPNTFHLLTYYHNGKSGNIDERTDIIDLVLSFL